MRRLAITGLLILRSLCWAGTDSVDIDHATLLQHVVRCVANALPAHTDFSADVLDLPVSLTLPVGELSVRFAGTPLRRWRGTFMRELEILVNGAVVHRQPVMLVVKTYAAALVAGKQLDRHVMVNAQDVLEQRIETTLMREDPLTEITSIEEKRLKRIVTAGSVLTPSLFEQCPVVLRGSEVEIIVASGAVRMSLKGIAREEGAPGTVINVQPEGRRDRIRATVVDAKRVRVSAE
jgi:flagella basal body P-ring formation protein FlgA